MRLHAVYKYKGIWLVERPMHTNAQERGNSLRELNQIVFICRKHVARDFVIVQKSISLFPSFCGSLSIDGVGKWVHSGPLPDASPQIKTGSIKMPQPYSLLQFGQIFLAACWRKTFSN